MVATGNLRHIGVIKLAGVEINESDPSIAGVSTSAIHRLAFHYSLPYSKEQENPYDYRNRYQ
jgi:hypothetical protein